jgi:hypothetical protein
MFLYNKETILEMFLWLQRHFHKAPIVNFTDLPKLDGDTTISILENPVVFLTVGRDPQFDKPCSRYVCLVKLPQSEMQSSATSNQLYKYITPRRKVLLDTLIVVQMK